MPWTRPELALLLLLTCGGCTKQDPGPTPAAVDAHAGGQDASILAGDAVPTDSVPRGHADVLPTDGKDVADLADAEAATTTDAVDAATLATADVGPPPPPPDAVDASEVAVDVDVGYDTVDLPLPTTAPATASCKDKRQRGDMKIVGDVCWAPPEHYCSSGGGAMMWFGCSPDQKACFGFDIFCHPCGWTKCPIVSKWDPPPTTLPPGCPTYMVYQDPMPITPDVLPYLPNDTVFCWDGAPASWKTLAAHVDDGKL